jgi:hypothetical protein
MSEWGIFTVMDCQSGEWSRHIAPCDAKGMILRPHIGAVDCECRPTPDPECPANWIHNDPERGGANA